MGIKARLALKGFRRMSTFGADGVTKALQLLIDTCHAEGNIYEEEAYKAVLSTFAEGQISGRVSTPSRELFIRITTIKGQHATKGLGIGIRGAKETSYGCYASNA